MSRIAVDHFLTVSNVGIHYRHFTLWMKLFYKNQKHDKLRQIKHNFSKWQAKTAKIIKVTDYFYITYTSSIINVK